jgi:DnaJ-class molecular chaperone
MLLETMSKASVCLTCQGSGEIGTDSGPDPCPDCFGAGKALSPGTRLDWRLSKIESTSNRLGRDAEADVLWLVHELRRNRAALLKIFARCQDADEGDVTARDVKYEANEALELYDPT